MRQIVSQSFARFARAVQNEGNAWSTQSKKRSRMESGVARRHLKEDITCKGMRRRDAINASSNFEIKESRQTKSPEK